MKLGKPGVNSFLAAYTYLACVRTLASLSISFLICKISIKVIWPHRAVTKMKEGNVYKELCTSICLKSRGDAYLLIYAKYLWKDIQEAGVSTCLWEDLVGWRTWLRGRIFFLLVQVQNPLSTTLKSKEH